MCLRTGKYLNAIKESGSPVVRPLPSSVRIGKPALLLDAC